MWIEVTGSESREKFMLNFDLIEAVHPAPEGGTKLIMPDGECIYIVAEDYETIKKMVLERWSDGLLHDR